MSVYKLNTTMLKLIDVQASNNLLQRATMDSVPPKASSSKKFPMTTLDGIRFEVEAEIAMEMEILKPLIEKVDNNGEPSMIPLPNVSSDSLVKLIDYIRMHLDLIEKAKTCCDENQNSLRL